MFLKVFNSYRQVSPDLDKTTKAFSQVSKIKVKTCRSKRTSEFAVGFQKGSSEW